MKIIDKKIIKQLSFNVKALKKLEKKFLNKYLLFKNSLNVGKCTRIYLNNKLGRFTFKTTRTKEMNFKLVYGIYEMETLLKELTPFNDEDTLKLFLEVK